MPSAALARLVTRCRGLSAVAAPDGELLRRFARSADPDAFAELLGRHAGLVWGVCRRTLPQEADAEDAFQAVFLALARGARSIDPSRPPAAWLHAVAVRVSRRVLGKTLRRRTAELPECVGPADVAADVSSRDLFRAVDEEIERLPTALRGPVVLCGLEGKTRDEAADALGCSVAAVKARLERARQALRRALARRGIALPAAFFALGLGAGRVGAGLKDRALKAALGAPSPAVAALAAGGSTSFGLMAVALAAVAVVGVAAFGLPQGQPKDPSPAAKEAPKADELTSRVDRFGDPLPDGAVRRFGTLRFRHEAVRALAFTPDGKRLVAGGGRGPLAVFDPIDGRKLHTIGEASGYPFHFFALSPDGKHVFTTGEHLAMYALDTGAKVRQFEAVRPWAVAVSPDGKKVAATHGDQDPNGWPAMTFDTETGNKLVDLWVKDVPADRLAPDLRPLAFSPDGKVVAGVVSEVKEIKTNVKGVTPIGVRLWEAATGNPLGTAGPADDLPHTFAFVPGTKRIAILGKGNVIRLWDLDAAKADRTIPLRKGDEPASDLVVSADGRRAAVYVRGSAVVFDLKAGAEVRRLPVGDTAATPVALALSPDGSVLALGKLYGDSAVRVWEVDSGKERLADAGHRGPAKLSLSADGKTLVSRGAGQVFRWDLATGEGKAKPDNVKDADGYIPDLSWSKTAYRAGRYRYVFDHGSGKIEVQSRDGSKVIASAGCPAEYVRWFAVSADGRSFAVSFQDRRFTVLLWTPEAHAEPFRLGGHPDAVQQMAFTHDGKYLIAGAGTHNAYPSETVYVYETATGKLVRKLATNSAPGHLLVTADDRTLLTGGLWNDAAVRAWDLATGRELAALVDPAVKVASLRDPAGGEVPSIGGLALSADERFLAVLTGAEGMSSVSLWDTGSWKLVKAFPPAKPRCDAGSLAVARGGRSVFVAYLDSTILEWAVAPRSAPAPAPTAARLDELWTSLADAERGNAAAWELLDHPTEAVPFLKTKLAPATPPDPAAVKDLVRKLGSDVFREREEAGKKLTALGEAVVPLVREVAAGGSAEAKERVERVIAALGGGLTGEQLRQRRAVAVLEWCEQPEADEHLRTLAGGDPAARQTKDARAAIQRRGRKAGNSD